MSFHKTKLGGNVAHAYHPLAVDERRRPFRPDLWTGNPSEGQTIEQVWFAGVHSNIGGGYRDCGLSNIALAWLAGRAASHGLDFITGSIAGMQCKAAGRCRLEDSFSACYQALRILGVRPYEREIGPNQCGDIRQCGVSVPGESAHPSAVDAIGESFAGDLGNAVYEPKNLISALEGGLPVWP